MSDMYLHDYAETLARLSRTLDAANATHDYEAQTWCRVAKVAEEAGEVISAYIGVTGQNPRKGFYGGMSNVSHELLDTAVTALLAHEHVNGNQGNTMARLLAHIIYIDTRANQ